MEETVGEEREMDLDLPSPGNRSDCKEVGPGTIEDGTNDGAWTEDQEVEDLAERQGEATQVRLWTCQGL